MIVAIHPTPGVPAAEARLRAHLIRILRCGPHSRTHNHAALNRLLTQMLSHRHA